MNMAENKKVSTQLQSKRKPRSIAKPKIEPRQHQKATSKVGLKSKTKPKKLSFTKPKSSAKKAKIRDSRCPLGQHWVRAHSMRVPASDKNLTGITIRRPHCARNPRKRQTLTLREVARIEKLPSFKSRKKPCPLKMGFAKGARYDDLIAGWVKYWNEIFKPERPLEANLIKALIASESSFEPMKLADPKNPKSGRGLMQLLDLSRRILADEKGELKNNFIAVSQEDLLDPSTNICAGIRWIFHKRKLLSGKLGRSASWDEVVAEYKGLTKDLKAGKPRAKELFDRFKRYLRLIEICKK